MSDYIAAYNARMRAREERERRTYEQALRSRRRPRDEYEANSSDVARPRVGLEPDGTPYVETVLPWVVGSGRDVVIVDTEIAARYGARITDHGTGVVTLET